MVLSLHLQSRQQQPPSQHLSKPRANDALKMRASVRMTRYLESWGAARPFASLNHRESLSTDILLPKVKRPKVRPVQTFISFLFSDIPFSPKSKSLAFVQLVACMTSGEMLWYGVLGRTMGEGARSPEFYF